MSLHREPLSVRMVDPSLSMFHTEMELLGALHPLVDDLALLAPPVNRDPTYPLPAHLPPIKGISLRRFAGESDRILGRSVQAYEYFANEIYSLSTLALRSSKPVIHVQFLSLFATNPFDERWLTMIKKAGAGLVYSVHNVVPHDKEHDVALTGRYQRVYHLADHLITHSHYQQELLVDQFAIDPAKISVIPLGPYFHRLQLPTPDEAKRQLALQGQGPFVLHFGHMRAYKGTEVLIRAMPEVLTHYPEARLLLAGPATSAREQELRSLIHAQNLDHCTHVQFGYVPTAHLANYFALADLTVLPYLKIDQSAVLLSALALGLPVVATDTGGVSETIRSQDLGYLAPVADTEALAAMISQVLAEPDMARQKAQRARAYVRETLGWDGIAEQTVAVYNQVLRR